MNRYEQSEVTKGIGRISGRETERLRRNTFENLNKSASAHIDRKGGSAIIRAKGGNEGLASGLRIEVVAALPAIPTSGGRFVFWTSDGTGTGDDQVWLAFKGQTAWTPQQKFTTKSGVPV